MKTNWIGLGLVILLIITQPISAFAHSGRTDSSGGHNCSQKSIDKGLCTGYHNHNSGNSGSSSSSSNSSSSSSSNSSSNSSSGSSTSSQSSNTSNSSTGSSSNTSSSSQSEKPAPKPEPKIDEKQVEADEHTSIAKSLVKEEKYVEALKEIEKVYDLNKDTSAIDSFVATTVSSIYSNAENALKDKEYDEAKKEANKILEYDRTSEKIVTETEELISKIETEEKYEEAIERAENKLDEKAFREVFESLEEAAEVKESDKTEQIREETIQKLEKDAKELYNNAKLKQAKTQYNLLFEVNKKDVYQDLITEIEGEERLVDTYGLDVPDKQGDSISLYEHLQIEDNETPYQEKVVDKLESLVGNAKDNVIFIFEKSITELFNGGEKDAA
ncbi:YHYH domain-containing protein [Pseudalkalibacillus hwajinpoensis]|uniref:YHYH domain-containing protein n=1 Tax=Guptibacillus hwajinpoensis TaxID=208199 RepID=UPI001CD70546|nr:YHYH domain-containing protein [Pseudalkalibacillus hwajinpoensis]MCA0993494.1 YHYH domain-containing protein [Pseudalkalibacillus hwajinpoensis]